MGAGWKLEREQLMCGHCEELLLVWEEALA